MSFCLFAESSDAVGLPVAAGDCLALKHMVVAFFVSVAHGTAGIETRGTAVECFTSGKKTVAAFEIEATEVVSCSEGLGKCIPMDRLDGIVAPAEALMEVGLK